MGGHSLAPLVGKVAVWGWAEGQWDPRCWAGLGEVRGCLSRVPAGSSRERTVMVPPVTPASPAPRVGVALLILGDIYMSLDVSICDRLVGERSIFVTSFTPLCLSFVGFPFF